MRWGGVERVGDRLKTTDSGNKLADLVASESEIFERVIRSLPVYFQIIQWIYRQKLELVTFQDIEIFFTDLQSDGQLAEISEAGVVSFFSLCHAAGLGISTIGKRGQPARLRIETARIEQFLFQNENARN